MRASFIAFVLTAMVAVLSGCGVVKISGNDGETMRTLSVEQANQRVEQHIADAVAAIPAGPRLEPASSLGPLNCDDPNDQGPLGRVTVANSYWLREIPQERNAEVLEAMHSYWLSHDYRVLVDKREIGVPALFVESDRDAFRMSLRANVEGDLYISATSPCVWPEGTPPPEVTGG